MAAQTSFAFDRAWIEVRDGDPSALSLFRRHYSFYAYRDQRPHFRFVGPGERMVLITPCARAIFIWRKAMHRYDGQQGVNCAAFRNEGAGRASDLIRAADQLARDRWPGERHFTYVDPRKVEPKRQPGRCFLKAGWQYALDPGGRRFQTAKLHLFLLELPAERIPIAV